MKTAQLVRTPNDINGNKKTGFLIHDNANFHDFIVTQYGNDDAVKAKYPDCIIFTTAINISRKEFNGLNETGKMIQKSLYKTDMERNLFKFLSENESEIKEISFETVIDNGYTTVVSVRKVNFQFNGTWHPFYFSCDTTDTKVAIEQTKSFYNKVSKWFPNIERKLYRKGII